MEVVFLEDETYKNLLELKNFISVKTREITNKEVLDNLKQGLPIYEQFNPREFDYEPEYTLGECISQIIGSTWNEQETGKVNYIT